MKYLLHTCYRTKTSICINFSYWLYYLTLFPTWGGGESMLITPSFPPKNIYGTLQYQATFIVEIFLISGSVWWLSIFMGMEFLQNSKSMISFIQWLPQKIQVSAFRCNLGCASYAQSWVFFLKYSKYSFFVALLLSW